MDSEYKEPEIDATSGKQHTNNSIQGNNDHDENFIDVSQVDDEILELIQLTIDQDTISDRTIAILENVKTFTFQKPFIFPENFNNSNLITVFCRLLDCVGILSELSIIILGNIWLEIEVKSHELFFEDELIDSVLNVFYHAEIPLKIHTLRALSNCFKTSQRVAEYALNQPDFIQLTGELLSIDHYSLRNELLDMLSIISKFGNPEILQPFFEPLLDMISINYPKPSSFAAMFVNTMVKKDISLARNTEDFLLRLLNGMKLGYTDTLVTCIDTICAIIQSIKNSFKDSSQKISDYVDFSPLFSEQFMKYINTAISRKLIEDSTEIYNLLANLSPEIDETCWEFGLIEETFDNMEGVSSRNKIIILSYLCTYFKNSPNERREEMALRLFGELLQVIENVDDSQTVLFLQTMININPDNRIEDFSDEWLEILDSFCDNDNEAISIMAQQYLQQLEEQN
ncbi:hypothetical protein TVAG_069910 [Trichomonas vaginalis G3]|uniref:Uncharacterized protein n=1 Tax=Trichomonas vaginalis (strain ATCC PRA-98 / G3) TaxID=412133 RepID=A2ESN2_TRIV3|nr:armadillo (ARM) repeat-containing protein family [Trichomonas vaginalis G3]EAY04341.1 hypothetical protein TVAG_069910 [Trichomonas vaginalis G3]KAI5551914.1 armadillo (ARM) repeat-containing protein family [Trichomonas vaginalis G3]|eukprot:XP_001316564.1 hypothetical protein [Trichomonas vaginalis G3]